VEYLSSGDSSFVVSGLEAAAKIADKTGLLTEDFDKRGKGPGMI